MSGSSTVIRRNGSTPKTWYASVHGPIVLPMTATSSPSSRFRISMDPVMVMLSGCSRNPGGM